jgi:hypothetical protein
MVEGRVSQNNFSSLEEANKRILPKNLKTLVATKGREGKHDTHHE